jgi:hypothetical protein
MIFISNISVVVHDGCDIIVGQIGLGEYFGKFGTCSGKPEKTDTCWLSTALREIGEEYKIYMTDDVFESRIETIVLMSGFPVILFNFHGINLTNVRDEVFAEHLHARDVFGLITDDKCKDCKRTPNETPEQSRIAANAEMMNLYKMSVLDLYNHDFQPSSRNAIYFTMLSYGGCSMPERPRHLQFHRVVVLWRR